MHEPFDQSSPESTSSLGSSRSRTLIAWGVTLFVVALVVSVTLFVRDPAVIGEEMGGAVNAYQGKYLLGMGKTAASMVNTNVGPINQRLGNVVMLADLKNTKSAREALGEIRTVMDEEIIEAKRASRNCYVSDKDEVAFDVLEKLYAEDNTAADVVPTLTGEERTTLTESLGWFGELALAPKGLEDNAKRKAMVASSRNVVALAIVACVLVAGAGFFGLVGLVMLLTNVANGNIPTRFQNGNVRTHVYIETFAIWLVLMVLGQLFAGIASHLFGPDYGMLPMAVVFFGSLIALWWPTYCGLPFAQVRRDIGWTLPKPAWATPVYGVLGYIMGLPVLAVGVALVVGLTMTLGLYEQTHDLAPANGPAHPIVLELVDGNFFVIFQVFFMAAVAAPVVEETVFRGVLYRHLRDLTRTQRWVVSVLLSTFVNALLFAAIHPQGLATIPALMALAIAFTLAREFLDSIVPSMIMHGISNALTLSIALTLFG